MFSVIHIECYAYIFMIAIIFCRCIENFRNFNQYVDFKQYTDIQLQKLYKMVMNITLHYLDRVFCSVMR